jgi:hypothetical protein
VPAIFEAENAMTEKENVVWLNLNLCKAAGLYLHGKASVPSGMRAIEHLPKSSSAKSLSD